jgi:PEP-CTERM motif
MRHSLIGLAFIAVVAATPALATVNLVRNGDFTDLTNGLGQTTDGAGITTAVGWTTPGFNQVLAVADQGVDTIYGAHNFSLWDQTNGGSNTWNGLAPVGNILAISGDFPTAYNPGIPSQGPVSQTVSGLTAGERYVVNFEYAFSQQYTYNGPTVQSLTVDMGSATFYSGNYDVANHDFVGWQEGQLNFTATSSSEVLSFLANGNLPVPPFALVSGVSITAVPEPSTWMLMLVGFAGLAYAGASARRKATAV